jgi:hypothetical protein
MEMILPTMSDLPPLFDDKVSFPMSMVLLEDLNSLGRTFRSGLDLFSWLPRGGLSLLYLSRLLHPRQYLFVLSALQRCWPACSVTFPYHNYIDTLANGHRLFKWLAHLELALWLNLKLWRTFLGIYRPVVWFYSAAFKKNIRLGRRTSLITLKVCFYTPVWNRWIKFMYIYI